MFTGKCVRFGFFLFHPLDFAAYENGLIALWFLAYILCPTGIVTGAGRE